MTDWQPVSQDRIEPGDAHEPFGEARFFLLECQHAPVVRPGRAGQERRVSGRVQGLGLKMLRQQRHAFEPANRIRKQIAHDSGLPALLLPHAGTACSRADVAIRPLPGRRRIAAIDVVEVHGSL